MVNQTLLDQELAAAEVAWNDGNDGKARVCARRAVALVTEAWLASLPEPLWRGDAMEHLRRIHQLEAFPLAIREAAERLSTAVPDETLLPSPLIRSPMQESSSSTLPPTPKNKPYPLTLPFLR